MGWCRLYDTTVSCKHGYPVPVFCSGLYIASCKAKRILKRINLVYNNRNAFAIVVKVNIMEALLILVITYIITLAAGYFYRKQLMFLKAARITLQICFFTGLSHFVYTEGKAVMPAPFPPLNEYLFI